MKIFNKSKKNISLEKFIYALGIRHIGLENAKILSKYLKSVSNFISISKDNKYSELLNIDGIGEIQINSVKIFFSNKVNLDVLNGLQKVLNIKDVSIEKKNGLLKDQTFMLTGKLNRN